MTDKELIRRALMGSQEAQQECTEKGIVLPCWRCEGESGIQELHTGGKPIYAVRSKKHPQKTRLQDFLEKYPDAEVLPDGQPVICCARLGYREYCGKGFSRDDCFSQCRDCWNMPVEE